VAAALVLDIFDLNLRATFLFGMLRIPVPSLALVVVVISDTCQWKMNVTGA